MENQNGKKEFDALQKDLKTKVQKEYDPKNIKDSKQEEVRVSSDRSKIVESVTYRNGVVKNRIVGVKKKGKIIYNSGMEKQFLPGNKKV